MKQCIVLLDNGNTRLKVGFYLPDTTTRNDSVFTIDNQNMEGLVKWFDSHNVRPESAIGVNVADNERKNSIANWLRVKYGVNTTWIKSTKGILNITNSYANHESLGSDRWISMVGLPLHKKDKKPVLLASFGTATTIDTLIPNSTGWQYLGGLIIPGITIMGTSLAQNTAHLPEAHGNITDFPDNTHTAISTGIVSAQAGAVLRQWWKITEKHNTEPTLFCSGGALAIVNDELLQQLERAQQLMGYKTTRPKYLRSPVLDGLARIAANNLHQKLT